MMGTRAHQLGMYVVLESYLGMVCDYPAAYEGKPGFEFIQKVPVVWDEMKVLAAEIGKYVVVARRSGSDWYIGAINNSESRTLELDFSFLKGGKWEAVLFRDAPHARTHPNELLKEDRALSSADRIKIKLAPGGGAAMQLIQRATF